MVTRPLSRRNLILAAAAGALPSDASDGEAIAFDLSLLHQLETPNELFFVRSHFKTPGITSDRWTLPVSGAVESPVALSLADLAKQSASSLPATLECAENPSGGGLISHAVWGGVRLKDVVALARPKPGVQSVRLSGADGFTRVVPYARAGDGDALLATHMNGDPLPIEHGAPVRCIIPGWYGDDSVKWLRSVELLPDLAQNSGSRRRTRSLLTGIREGDPVARVLVKSAFSRPREGAVLMGRRFILRGAAWAGERSVKRVEVSVDGGRMWTAAALTPGSRYCWTHWHSEWKIGAPGSFELLVRATDDGGDTQPLDRDASRADAYEQNHCQRISITVV